MPGTFDYLKDKLMRAIDAEGNVLDIVMVTEVIRDLEHVQLTAEDLTMTRLGRIVNSARRRMPDKSLARRMKNLVKQWQKLAVGLNGTTTTTTSVDSNRSTPSPAKPIATAKRTTTNDGHLLKQHSGSGSNTRTANDVVSLSTETRPPIVTPPTSSHVTPRLPSSKPSLVPNCLEQNTPTDVHNCLEQTTPTNIYASQLNGQSNSNLIISLPLKQISKRQKHDDLQQQRITHKQQGTCKQQQELPVTSLIVRVPLKFFQLPSEQHELTQPPTPPPTQLIVRIELSVLKNTEARYKSTTSSPPSSVTTVSTSRECMEDTVFHRSVGKEIRLASPSGRLKSLADMPNNGVEGVDGCVGGDGCWHAWDDYIPSVNEESVTVLPYVYIDGLSGYDKEQTWSSLDTDELIASLQYS